MNQQINTIRAGIEAAHIIGGQEGIDKALTALDQLEAMVGEQEPMAYLTRDEDGDKAMLFFDRIEAATYCEEGVEPEALVLAFAAPVAQQAQPCGHPTALLLRSAETGEPLYCEACDDKSGRRDAERMEADLQAVVSEQDPLKLHAIEELCQLGYTVKDGELFPPDHLNKLMEAAGHPLAAQQAQAEAVPVGVLHRGEGGAFHYGFGDHLLAVYALPPGDHDLYAAPQQAEAVPPTHVLVPVEPTPEILKALGNPWDGVNRATWQRVLAAAPQQKGGA